jgi:hypothetical protein
MRRIIAMCSIIVLTACVATTPESDEQSSVTATSSASSESMSAGSAEIPVSDEKSQELERTTAITAGMSIPTPGPGDIACISDILGIRFYHPESWGKCNCVVESGFPNGYSAQCTFPRSDFYISAISKDYEDENGGRGLSTAEAIAMTADESWTKGKYTNEEMSPIVRRELLSGEEVSIWNDWPVGWDTGDYVFAFRAPTKHSAIKIIGAVGPLANSADTTEKDIRDFLLAAYTYELLP